MLYNYHLYLVPKHFVTPKGNPVFIKCYPDTHRPANISLCACSVNLPVLDISVWKESYNMWLLCLVSFTEYNVFKIRPRCSIFQYYSPFYSGIILYEYTTICLPVLPLLTFCLFCLFWIDLFWTYGCICLSTYFWVYT